ncbi:MAG: putative lipid II flippase FtsW [bacterium]|nr:putative lipid II flippase FtsW [bacterium]
MRRPGAPARPPMNRRTNMRRPTSGAPDYLFLGTVLTLTIFGIVMLTSASSDLASTKFGDSSYFVMHQLLYGLLPGMVGFLVGCFAYYRRWQRFATPFLVLSIVLLVLVFTGFGVSSVKGADRWLNFGAFTFQPSELLKLTFFIYLAAWVSRSTTRGSSFVQGFLPFLTLVGGVMVLLLLQPATTVAILIFLASVLMYFTSGAKIRFLAVAALVVSLALSVFIYFSPYRKARVLTFLNPTADTADTGYHINQALIAIGSGGWTGVGFGQSTTKLYYLPEPIGDSIFAVIAEELGFLGSLFVLLAFSVLIWRGLRIARHTSDSFGRIFVTGCTCLIGLQAFVNIAAVSGLVPLTGVPLPFVSYGGTALTVFLTMSGIMVNVSRYQS